ncbi:hypothetical protein GCM10011351_18220 [Paraliobacillus quinghaiensis]|uniref:TATA-box binding protein n=1 Tax=Paraliobacillus quinghaiensis TaxID=470815 RepID=A0A917WVG0_9BACI|nr:YwmB family TATA-box binding protein [Paraliobacillus quinghaiensis]GGM32508.1 hypothetical protein GCM10011351_18220 [Paraliobacillus quinghaiensis]
MNKNKRIVMVLVLLITMTAQIQVTAVNKSSILELVDLMEIVEEQDMQVSNWQVRLKETFEKQELSAIIHNINQAGFSKTYTIEESDQMIKYIYPPLKNEHTAESLIIVVAKQHETAEVIYTIESTGNGTFQEVFVKNRIRNVMEELFSENMTKLTCVISEADDNIRSDYFFETIKENLRVQELNRLHEKDFIVISGYTEKWDATIPIWDEQMNVQVAARNDANGKTTFTLGTPILTNEY